MQDRNIRCQSSWKNGLKVAGTAIILHSRRREPTQERGRPFRFQAKEYFSKSLNVLFRDAFRKINGFKWEKFPSGKDEIPFFF